MNVVDTNTTQNTLATMAPMVVAHPNINSSPFGDKHIKSLESPVGKDPELLNREEDEKQPNSNSAALPLVLGKQGGKPESFHSMTSSSSKSPSPKGKKQKVLNGYANGVAASEAVPQAMGSLLIQAKSVTKVIKGEVHNVLNVMRTDPRYVSPLRFIEELPMDEQHPLLLQLRELHQTISEWEISSGDKIPPAPLYLAPFCDAIKGRDISAPVTGAALHAIHKFVLYGFFAEQPDAFRTIANTLLLCTFEETTPEVESRRRNKGANSHEDEQVVLKLLDLSALVVRYASLELKPDIIVGLLDTCLHVSHKAKRASSLLKSAASDALGQITLEVFSHPHLAKAREAILSKLASLLNPQKNSDAYVVNSLMLVNIALETLTDNLTETEISILQNDVCKFLLGWSTSHDLVILSLTMRVIFNLFQTISNHLKVPLEVFLTSVHLRILEHSKSNEEREVALESLLEFCQEPALMKDLYLNYDCDVNCTNLFAQICATLGEVAGPTSVPGIVSVEVDKSFGSAPKLNGDSSSVKSSSKAISAGPEIPMNALSFLAVEGILTIIESIARRVKASSMDKSLDRTNTTASTVSVDDIGMSEHLTEEEYQEQKKQKLALSKIAEVFNNDPTKDEWIHRGKDLGVALDTAEDVASVLFKAPGIDKTALGEYLGKGPAEKYPFEDKVRRAFVAQIDFTTHDKFAQALRVFLHKFRMPGEAQCIDRFMEAFAAEFFKQRGEATSLKSVDATYVLAFSTIMLNTDLHNPMNKNPRMTCEQFITNNRGINDGEDIPIEMLEELYDQIKEQEIQVQQDLGEFINLPEGNNAEHFRSAWGELLTKQVVAASFTPAEEAIKTINQVGIHEKEMFLVIAKPALQGIGSTFVRSWDDGCILSCLKGLEQMARIATYFNLDDVLNDIMSLLLSQGRDFISGCISLEFAGIESGAPIAHGSGDDDDTMSIVDPDSPIPQLMLKVQEFESVDLKTMDISGSAAYRGLLALNTGLKIVRALFPKVRGAWPQLVDVICSLRDARALPPGLADLDDFADSDGNVLPLSAFAKKSQKKLDDYYKGITEKEQKKSWFRMSFFGRKDRKDKDDQPMRPDMPRGQMTANQKTLLQVSQRVGLEKILVFGEESKLSQVKQSISGLLMSIDKFPANGSPFFEQHQAFALELAARALLVNKERAPELLQFFLPKFDAICSRISRDAKHVSFPFLVERVVVTILRTSIHLFEVPQLRPKLRASLYLLPKLPKAAFVSSVADRMACGLAIILRGSFQVYKSPDDWRFTGDIFDILAMYKSARGLTFDGIASTIEFAIPDMPDDDLEAYEAAIKDKPTLSLLATAQLQRVLFKLAHGTYENDRTLAVPAMVCIEKTYKHIVQLSLIKQNHEDPDADLESVPDKEVWYRVALALYSVCCSPNHEVSKQGFEACQRHMVSGIFMEEVPDDKWIGVLKAITTKQPPVSSPLSRINSFSLLGQMMVRLFPIMSVREKNWKDLTEVTKNAIIISDENMQNSYKGEPMFNYTVKIVANIYTQMASPNFGGEKRYCSWASDAFKKALEKNGAVKNKTTTGKDTPTEKGTEKDISTRTETATDQ